MSMNLEMKGENWRYTDDVLKVDANISGEWDVRMCQTTQLPEISGDEEIARKIKNPISGETLPEIVRRKNAKTACVLVSDATRAVPTRRIAKVIVQELLDAGMALSDITFFVALGVHRPATEAEFQEILGDLYGKVAIVNHTPFEEENLIYLGKTSGNTPVKVNRQAYECDLHIQIGKVEPHEFAGFSGGRKSVLPGVSSEETIIINHRPEMILNPKSAIGVLEGNPVHADMVEAAEWFGIDFAVNCILNNDLNMAAVFAGGLKESHETAVNYVKDKLSVVFEKPDIIVTTPGRPLDIDFYQTVKALIALTEVLDESTTVVLYCGCEEGVNSPDMLRAFGVSEDLEEVISYTNENYKIQMDHVLLLSKILRKKVRILVSCPNIPDKELEAMFMTPCHSLQEAIETAAKLTGKAAPHVLFYPRPQTGLPALKADR